MLPDISVEPVAGLPGSERAQGGAAGAWCVSSVWDRLRERDKHRQIRRVHKLSQEGKKVFKENYGMSREVSSHSPFIGCAGAFFFVTSVSRGRVLLRRFHFCVLQPLMHLKDAALDRTVNFIRIINVKSLSISTILLIQLSLTKTVHF